jgi:hypothetical protein
MVVLELIHFLLNVFQVVYRKRVIKNSYKVNPGLAEILNRHRQNKISTTGV